jgi:hypothetical protein
MPETTLSSVPPSRGAQGVDVNAKSDQNTANTPAPSSSKLGTFSGAFVPTTLNIFSILMFLRFGFILGQTGILGFLGESKNYDTICKVVISYVFNRIYF